MKQIVLGSSSPYRRSLLSKILPQFETCAPEIDETPRPGEEPASLAARLAEAKARAVAAHYPDALIIASDQVAVVNGRVQGKPGDHARAVAQLKACSGNQVTFLTALCLYDGNSNQMDTLVEPFQVYFRELSPQEIERYLTRETPYDCAGSFKSEGLGIALFERMEGDDPNTLIGLPLIKLAQLLRNRGIQIP